MGYKYRSQMSAVGGMPPRPPFFSRHRLLRSWGPLLVALALVSALFFSPFTISRRYSVEQLESVAMNPGSRAAFVGFASKEQVLADPKFLPILGSSELEHVDRFHPSVYFHKYPMGFTPYPAGQIGTQSLSHFFFINSVASELGHRKLVVIVSPQWFVKTGAHPVSLENFISKGELYNWLSKADPGQVTTRQLAGRLRQVPGFKDDLLIGSCLEVLSEGHSLSGLQRLSLAAAENFWRRQDSLFSLYDLGKNSLSKPITRTKRLAASLPEHPSPGQLEALAFQEGQRGSTNNPYQMRNDIWQRNSHLFLSQKDAMRNVSYQSSPEYADFQQVLSRLADLRDDILFVIPPVNGAYERLAGLPLDTLRRFSHKISYQLRSQGFNRIFDMTENFKDPYYCEDTIHFGTRGWLAVDRAIADFMRQPFQADYRIDNSRFLSTWWQTLEQAPDQASQQPRGSSESMTRLVGRTG